MVSARRLADYPAKSRATMGVVSIKVSERNGAVVGAAEVVPGEHLMLISITWNLGKNACRRVSQVGRNTQGVTLIRTGDPRIRGRYGAELQK